MRFFIFTYFNFSDNLNIEEYKVALAFQVNKLLLKKETNIKISKTIQDKIAVKNVPTFYNLSKIYNIDTVGQFLLSYMEHNFQTVVETQNFLHF